MARRRSGDRSMTAGVPTVDQGGPGSQRMDRRELLRRVRTEITTHGLTPENEAQAIRLAELLVNGPTVSRRRLIQATAAGWAALAVAAVARPAHAARDLSGLGDDWLPVPTTDPVLAAAAPTLTASVLRREDMLALRLEFYNLVRSGMNLVRQAPGDPAYVVATLGYGADHAPQNIAEQAFREGSAPADNDPLAEPGEVDARLAGGTRLAFLVPSTLLSMPYQLTSILALLPQLKLNVAAAALPPGATPTSAPALADPGPLETRIEAPWKLVLSPHDGATWSHAVTPVTRNGRTELWHTRLSENDPVGRAVRAIWTEGYDRSSRPDPANVTDPFLMSLSPNDRWQIVGLSADFGIDDDYTPRALDVDRLMLTALGAWLDSNGTWETLPSSGNYDMVQWRHIATMGRDQYVKVVQVGILFPFGHRAVRVAITERKVNPVQGGPMAGKPGAYLRRREFIVVRQPVVTYPEQDAHEPNGGNQRPFTSVELKTLVTPDLGANLSLVGDEAYFPQSGGAPVPFNIAATDREGRISEFTDAARVRHPAWRPEPGAADRRQLQRAAGQRRGASHQRAQRREGWLRTQHHARGHGCGGQEPRLRSVQGVRGTGPDRPRPGPPVLPDLDRGGGAPRRGRAGQGQGSGRRDDRTPPLVRHRRLRRQRRGGLREAQGPGSAHVLGRGRRPIGRRDHARHEHRQPVPEARATGRHPGRRPAHRVRSRRLLRWREDPGRHRAQGHPGGHRVRQGGLPAARDQDEAGLPRQRHGQAPAGDRDDVQLQAAAEARSARACSPPGATAP